MPKMKSNRGASKRMKVTGSGKIKRKSAYKRHILTKKSAKRKRNLGKTTLVSVEETPKMRRLLLA